MVALITGSSLAVSGYLQLLISEAAWSMLEFCFVCRLFAHRHAGHNCHIY